MKHIFKTTFILLLLAFNSTLPAQNRKYSVSGSVADAVTMQPLVNVNISIVGTSYGGTTNQAGEFS